MRTASKTLSHAWIGANPSLWAGAANPLPADMAIGTSPLTLTGLVAGSDITFIKSGTEDVLLNIEDHSGTSYTYEHPVYSPVIAVDISIYKPGYIPHTTIRNFPLALLAASLPIVQTPDPSYLE